jgi:hypothetical protein
MDEYELEYTVRRMCFGDISRKSDQKMRRDYLDRVRKVKYFAADVMKQKRWDKATVIKAFIALIHKRDLLKYYDKDKGSLLGYLTNQTYNYIRDIFEK